MQGKTMNNNGVEYNFIDSVLNVKACEVSSSGISQDLEKPDGKSISELIDEENKKD
jgi:hypothetical protein